MSWYLDTAAASAVLGLVGGLGVPALIRRIPEPVSGDEEVDEADAVAPPDITDSVAPPEAPDDVVGEPKELYVSVAATRGLGWKSALASGIAAGLVGARVGWAWELVFLLYLVPVGVALAVVDWRTRLLPTRVIAPSYAVVVVLAMLAAVLGQDLPDLVRAGWGWVVAGGTFLPAVADLSPRHGVRRRAALGSAGDRPRLPRLGRAPAWASTPGSCSAGSAGRC